MFNEHATAKQTTKTWKDILLKKNPRPLMVKLSSMEEEPNKWENEEMSPFTNASQFQAMYQDENVSSKTPKKSRKFQRDSEEESSESGLPSYHTSPSPSTPSESKGEEIEYQASSPSRQGTSEMRTSKSLDLTLNQINRALGSFKIFNSEEDLKLKEQIGPEEASQASRITDSCQITNKPKELNRGRGEPKEEAVKTATKTNPEADSANKTLTRSRGKALASQQLQSQQNNESNKCKNQKSNDQHVLNTRLTKGSSLTIKRI